MNNINTLISELLTAVTKTYSKKRGAGSFPLTPGEYWELDKESRKSESLPDADPNIMAIQPSCELLTETSIKILEYNSYDEFWETYNFVLTDKFMSRYSQILYWNISVNRPTKYTLAYNLNLVILAPARGEIESVFIKVTPEDAGRIKRLLKKAALFNLYNFKQAFK